MTIVISERLKRETIGSIGLGDAETRDVQLDGFIVIRLKKGKEQAKERM